MDLLSITINTLKPTMMKLDPKILDVSFGGVLCGRCRKKRRASTAWRSSVRRRRSSTRTSASRRERAIPHATAVAAGGEVYLDCVRPPRPSLVRTEAFAADRSPGLDAFAAAALCGTLWNSAELSGVVWNSAELPGVVWNSVKIVWKPVDLCVRHCRTPELWETFGTSGDAAGP